MLACATQIRGWKALTILLAIVLSWILNTARATADVIILKNDGRVVGKISTQTDVHKDSLLIRTSAGSDLMISKSQIKQIIPQSPADEEYDRIRGNFEDTAVDQYKLAEWCRDKKLTSAREEHLKRVIELEPDHPEARSALGYMQVNGRWSRLEDRKKEEGYVLYRGDWKLPQEIELLEEKRQKDAKEHEWFSKLTKIRADILRGSPQRQEEALTKLKELTDTSAIPAIMNGLKNENAIVLTKAYMEVLSRIGSGNSLQFVVNVAIENGNDTMQEYAADLLRRNKKIEITAYLVQELRSKSNRRVNRAAEILGELGDITAVPSLIEALTTVHTVPLGAAGNPGSIGASMDQSGGGGLSVGSKPQIVSQQVDNRDVLKALEKLTRINFQFNKQAWKNWYASQNKTPIVGGRRD